MTSSQKNERTYAQNKNFKKESVDHCLKVAGEKD